MLLWRISLLKDLGGLGGEYSSGRWDTKAKQKRVVYLAEHPALSLLETIVNLKSRPEDGTDRFQLLRIEAPETVEVEQIYASVLPFDWRERIAETQGLGDAWLDGRRTALLAVPSAPSPESKNYLLHPKHPDAIQLRVEWARCIRFDERFFRLSE